MEYRRLSDKELAGKIMTKTDALFGPSVRTYVCGGPSTLGDEYNISSNYDMRESKYTLEYDTGEYARGKMYTYEVDIPRVGLVVTERCNGYGSGTSLSLFISKVIVKRGRVWEFEAHPIYWFDAERCYFDIKSRRVYVQSGSKSGDWKPKGSSIPLTSYITFGCIDLPNKGFDK